MTTADYIFTKSDEAAVAEGCYLDIERAERAIAWIERTFSVTLYRWQRDILFRYFSWRRPDGRYRFIKINVWIPKKNGKSWLVAALIVYKLFELRNARVFSAAVNAKQAGVVLDQAITILKGSSKIRVMMRPRTGKIRAFNSPFRREIIVDVTGSRYLSLADSPDAADGLIPDVQVFDEIHRMKNRTVDILDGNSANSPNCLKVTISTAGSGDKTHRSWQRYEYTKKVLAGEIVDTQLLAIVYECPNAAALKGEAIYDLDLLTACNPVLAEVPEKREQAMREIAEAREIRNDAYWRRFRLGQWLAQDGESYIGADEYATCEVDSIGNNILAVADCFIGLDKSGGVWDFHGITALYMLGDGRVYEKHFTFAGADRLEEMGERDDQDYNVHVDAGNLIAIPADAVTDEFLYGWFKANLAKHRIKKIVGDPYAASYLLERWKADGFDVVTVQQSNNRMLTPVIEDYADRIRQKRIIHTLNALYVWQLSCARAFTTAKDCKKIVKTGSTVTGKGGSGHIDNVDALINALAALRAAEIETAAHGNSTGIVIG
ncbi:MAG: terminase large subunit [Phycisphaerales bacterium]|nr:terminase large subunit [Phycisphaerales bacterium]